MALFRSTLLTGAALAALSFGAAAQNPAVSSTHGKGHGFDRSATDRSLTVLHDQTANDSDLGTFSQTGFGPSSAAADDFVVPKGTTWAVKEIDVDGKYFNGYGPATASVTFYADKKGKVGNIVAAFDHIAATGNDSSVAVTLGPIGQKLKSGHYWVSVVADVPSGDWAWENQTTTEGDPAMWEAPGGSNCTTWTVSSECGNPSGDLMFVLKGKAK